MNGIQGEISLSDIKSSGGRLLGMSGYLKPLYVAIVDMLFRDNDDLHEPHNNILIVGIFGIIEFKIV